MTESITAEEILFNLRDKHGVKLEPTPDILSLIRYTMLASYNEGWEDGREFERDLWKDEKDETD